jgi:uncharacterized coiled-coil protein SlyX
MGELRVTNVDEKYMAEIKSAASLNQRTLAGEVMYRLNQYKPLQRLNAKIVEQKMTIEHLQKELAKEKLKTSDISSTDNARA